MTMRTDTADTMSPFELSLALALPVLLLVLSFSARHSIGSWFDAMAPLMVDAMAAAAGAARNTPVLVVGGATGLAFALAARVRRTTTPTTPEDVIIHGLPDPAIVQKRREVVAGIASKGVCPMAFLAVLQHAFLAAQDAGLLAGGTELSQTRYEANGGRCPHTRMLSLQFELETNHT